MIVALVASCFPAVAQVTLGDCIEKARRNNPQIKERGLIKEAEKYDLSNAKIGWLPQLNISGKATYQSDVVEMPFEIPGYEFNLPHDQYSLVAELSQTIWDGGATASKKRMVRADAELQDKQLDVSLYAVRQRVENVFLGILLIDKQIKQNEILLRSLRRNRDEVAAMIESGLSYKADLNIVDVNILNCRQKMTELLSDRGAYVIMLSRLTGENMTDKDFVEPAASLDMDSSRLDRPELALYKAQLRQAEVQRQDLQSDLYPKLSFSLQGGVGRPGLNMLKNEFDPYYTVGLKMQWNIGALYSRRNDMKKIEVQESRVEAERETFVFNTMLDVTDRLNTVEKAEKALEQDKEIIRLRTAIRESGEEQYKQGVIKMTDLMDMIDDEHDARIAESLHQMQLIMAVCELKNVLGQ